MIAGKMQDPEAFARWFGVYNTTRKYPDVDWRPSVPLDGAQVRQGLAENVPLLRNPASRFSFVRQEAAVLLFVDGQCFDCADETAAFAEQLCGQYPLATGPSWLRSARTLELISKLYNQGSMAFDRED